MNALKSPSLFRKDTMSADDLLKYRSERPFEAFRIVMSDGAAYDVISPEWFTVGLTSSYLAIPSLERPELAHYIIRLANDHITHTWPLVAARERAS